MLYDSPSGEFFGTQLFNCIFGKIAGKQIPVRKEAELENAALEVKEALFENYCIIWM